MAWEPHLCIHLGTHVYTLAETMTAIRELKKDKKEALINSCLTLLNVDGPVHKSGFYGLYSVPNPMAFSLWSPLLAQQSQGPTWPVPWRQYHPFSVWKTNAKIYWKLCERYLIKPATHCELCKGHLSTNFTLYIAFLCDCCIKLTRIVT